MTNYFGPRTHKGVASVNASAPIGLLRRREQSLRNTGSAAIIVRVQTRLARGLESLRAEVHDQHPGYHRHPGVVRTDHQHALTGSGGRYGKTMPAYERGMDPDLCATLLRQSPVVKRRS
jgi:hypothetical protein